MTAFSRDQEDKVYVQHRLEQNADLLAELVVEQGASFDVAGNSENMPTAVREALVAADPEWAAFPIVSSLEYLGLMMGPGVTLEMQWSAPLKKYVERVGDIARSRADAHAAGARLLGTQPLILDELTRVGKDLNL